MTHCGREPPWLQSGWSVFIKVGSAKKPPELFKIWNIIFINFFKKNWRFFQSGVPKVNSGMGSTVCCVGKNDPQLVSKSAKLDRDQPFCYISDASARFAKSLTSSYGNHAFVLDSDNPIPPWNGSLRLWQKSNQAAWNSWCLALKKVGRQLISN